MTRMIDAHTPKETLVTGPLLNVSASWGANATLQIGATAWASTIPFDVATAYVGKNVICRLGAGMFIETIEVIP